MQKKYLKKVLAFIMSFVFLFNTIPLAVHADDDDYSSNSLEENRQKLQDLQSQSEKLAAERKQIQAQISNAQNQKEQQQVIKESLFPKDVVSSLVHIMDKNNNVYFLNYLKEVYFSKNGIEKNELFGHEE